MTREKIWEESLGVIMATRKALRGEKGSGNPPQGGRCSSRLKKTNKEAVIGRGFPTREAKQSELEGPSLRGGGGGESEKNKGRAKICQSKGHMSHQKESGPPGKTKRERKDGRIHNLRVASTQMAN